MMNSITTLFFSREYENRINNESLYYTFKVPEVEILNYVEEINLVPIEELLDHMFKGIPNKVIEAEDICQFSNFDDATNGICKVFIDVGNPGLQYLEIGKLLQNDGVKRNKAADLKYGENHVKTAEILGLTFRRKHTYFLGCIGFIFNGLSDEDKEKLLTRLILRSNFICRLYKVSQLGVVDVKGCLYMISESTYIRRRPNVKRLLDVLGQSEEYDFSTFLRKLEFR